MGTPVRKIAFILPNFQAGGAERVMVTVANHIDRTQFQPVLIVCADSGPLRAMVSSDIEVVSLGKSCSWRAIPALAAAVKSSGAVLAISTMAHLNILMLLAKPLMPGISVVVREAVTPSYFSASLFKRTVLTLAYHLLYPFADRILSPTQMVFDEMPLSLRRHTHKLQRIFNPVDMSLIWDAAADLREAYVRPDQRLFVGAGRLVDQKGFDRLIESLRDWRDRDDWRLIILGDGPDHAKLAALKDLYGLNQIKLAGFESKPWRYFALADAFVLPSRHEGLPNVALEALALGVPVIAMESAGGIAEIAAVSQDGAVLIADDMGQFVDLMDGTVVDRRPDAHVSLLPKPFGMANVVAAYQGVFMSCLEAHRAPSDENNS